MGTFQFVKLNIHCEKIFSGFFESYLMGGLQEWEGFFIRIHTYTFGAGDDTGVYWSNEQNYSKETMLFFTTSMGKSILGKFDFGRKLRSSKSLNFKMNLPTINNQPDFHLMQTLISAIQKLVLKDVVLYVEDKHS